MKSILLFFILLISAPIIAQTSLLIDAQQSSLTITGETNLSDWEETVSDFKGSIVASYTGSQLQTVERAELQIPVTAIEADKKGMRKDTYEALKETEHPEITFLAKTVVVKGNKIKFIGELTIAGKSKTVTIVSNYTFQNQTLVLKGTHQLNMQDYGVEPPSAMFGTLKVDALVNLSFSLAYKVAS